MHTFDLDINHDSHDIAGAVVDVEGRVVFRCHYDPGDSMTPPILDLDITDVEVLVQLHDDADDPVVILECPGPDELQNLIGPDNWTALWERANEEAESRVRGE